MPAPLALAAVKPVSEAVQGAIKVLSTDLVKAEGKVYRRIVHKVPLERDGKILLTPKGRIRYTRVETLEPIDVSLHLNPVGLLAAAVGVGIANVVWEGLEIHSGLSNITVIPALKDKVAGAQDPEVLATLTCDELRPTLFEQFFVPAAVAAKTAVARAAGCAWAQ